MMESSDMNLALAITSESAMCHAILGDFSTQVGNSIWTMVCETGVGVGLVEDEQAMDAATNARSMAGTNLMVFPHHSS